VSVLLEKLGEYLQQLGNEIKVVRAIAPQVSSGGNITGATIDRSDFYSATLFVDVGTASGSPTSLTVDCKLQESDDGTTFADIQGATISQITAANKQAELDINLNGRKKYIRAVATVAFSGGTSPTVPVSAVVVQGLGILGRDIFLNFIVDSPDNAIFLVDTGGFAPDYTGEVVNANESFSVKVGAQAGMLNPTVQIRVRNVDIQQAYAKAWQIYNLLHGKSFWDLSDTVHILSCQAMQQPFWIGRDAKGRDEVSCNYYFRAKF